jgi:RimJ/RimL family protein N-acetyltransferase
MQLQDYTISVIQNNQVEAFLDHMERQIAENGQGDTPIFTAIDPSNYQRNPDELVAGWNTKLSEPGWVRNWAAWANGNIIGNIQFNGARYPSEKHRVELSMAIESGHRGIGLGSKFMSLALDWATENEFDWADLGVFSENEPAIALYKKFGFEQYGYCKDQSRILGQNIDLIRMTKSLSQ